MNTQQTIQQRQTAEVNLNLNSRQIALLRRSLFVLKPRIEKDATVLKEVDDLNGLLAAVTEPTA